MDTITAEQYAELRTRLIRHEAWRGDRTSYHQSEIPADCAISNEERSKIEVYEFVNNPPDRYFLYIKEEDSTAITFTGDKLGAVSFGREWRDNFGGKRQSVTIAGVNGKSYHGTYYKSSGNYARIRLYKHQLC